MCESVRVAGPEDGIRESQVTLALYQRGEARMAARLEQAVDAHERWPSPVEHEGKLFALFAGADGRLVAAGLEGEAPLGAASFYATEEPLEGTPTGQCTTAVWNERVISTGEVRFASSHVDATRFTSRVTLYDTATFAEVANEAFPIDMSGCAREVYPDRERIVEWIGEQLPDD